MPYGDIDQLSRSQQKLIRQIIKGARRHEKVGKYKPRERRKAINTALAVGYTEKRFTDTTGGDRDSSNWRQERAMYYGPAWAKSGGPTNAPASIDRFFDEYHADAPKGGSLGQRAQAVQQSGTPHVWDDLAPLANRLRKEFGSTAGGGRPSRGGARVTTTPGVDNSPIRQQLKLDYLANRGKPGALLDLAAGLQGAADVPGKVTVGPGERLVGKAVEGIARSSGDNPKLANTAGRTPAQILRLAEKADRLNNAGKLPYRWGGGHGPTPAQIGELVDCSGFVSQLLGVSPRVSGQFAQSWGRPGKGKFLTVYANPDHVLLSVRDPKTKKLRWYGTSRQNPGGGAGEIAPPDPGYLSGFTARHPGRAKK